MRVWSLSGYVHGAVLIVNYQPRKLRMSLVAGVASKLNTLYVMRMVKRAWLGAVILTAKITPFITARSLWTVNGFAVTRTVSTQNISNKKGQ